MRTLGQVFQNEDLVLKFLRCLCCSLQPKVTPIYEFRDLSSMDMTTLFGKLEEHEMELKKLVEDEDGDKNKNT